MAEGSGSRSASPPQRWASFRLRDRSSVGQLSDDLQSRTLLGDALTDIDAARTAGVSIVGYANKPWKATAIAGAAAVGNSMGNIAKALAAGSSIVWKSE